MSRDAHVACRKRRATFVRTHRGSITLSRHVRPERISHYRVVGELGAGGMGEVLRAVDERLGREVALKILAPEKADQPDRQMRMLREAQAASALQHPGIVVVHDVGVHDRGPYIVMELVTGETF